MSLVLIVQVGGLKKGVRRRKREPIQSRNEVLVFVLQANSLRCGYRNKLKKCFRWWDCSRATSRTSVAEHVASMGAKC